jgi:hypothetical protein
MENTFTVIATYPTGQEIKWEYVENITSNLHGYLMTYIDPETGEMKNHQFMPYEHVAIRLKDPK